MRRTQANDKWLIPGEFNTQTNCFYVSWCMLKWRDEFVQAYAAWLAGETKKYPDFNERAHSMKVEKLGGPAKGSIQ